MINAKEFTLLNQNNVQVSLKEQLKDNHLWLIFFRGNF